MFMKKNILITIIIALITINLTIVYFGFKNYILSNELTILATTNKNRKNDIEEYKNKIEELTSKIDDTYNDILKDREGTVKIDTLKNIDLTGINKIMISTHPDDEMFWGGGHLIEDDYLVVCVTCGMDENRKEEFEKIMSLTKDKYLTLSYPRVVDPKLNREFDWRTAAYLTEDLENILSLKDWDTIVTHNPSGEYGHKYHRLTSQIVTSLVKDKSRLYYFGKYYKKDETSLLSKNTLKKATYDKKMKFINDTYLSQAGSVKNHNHMFQNENFIKYKDWTEA